MRLLLAEDEEDLSRALVAVLKHNNYSVDAVYDGAEALDYIENSDNYDGVILDIMMPKMDGITVLKTIRNHGNSVPVLMLTAKAEIDDRVEGLDSGADDYLTKPFSMKELLARIRAMTRRKADTTDSVLTFGDITLDRSTYMLTGPASIKNAGDVILKDADGNEIISYTAQKKYDCVIISTAALKAGQAYTLSASGSESEVSL